MTIKQISIFLENKSGRLADVLNLLGREKITIHALTIADTSEYGILRLIVSDYQKALDVLKKETFSANLTDVIAISIPDKAGECARILEILDKEYISIEYMYAFSRGPEALVILRPDNVGAAHTVLTEHNSKFITEGDL